MIATIDELDDEWRRLARLARELRDHWLKAEREVDLAYDRFREARKAERERQ